MSSNESQKKGDALEEAVRWLEQTILEQSPGTKDTAITIESKKIVIIDGVKHEIDLFITLNPGSSYKSVFIFECKNWEEAVGKNEIIVFSEKIDAVQAQKGYFIATRFGEYAIAQAKKDRRIELREASTEVDTLPSFIANFHILHTTPLNINLHFKVIPAANKNLVNLPITKAVKVRWKNEELPYDDFARRIYTIIKDETMNHEPTANFSEGSYSYERTQTFSFSPNELFMNELECREIDAHVIWEALIIRPLIVSKFDIKERGKVITLESDKFPDGYIKAAFINIYEQKD